MVNLPKPLLELTLTRQPDDSYAHLGKVGHLIFEIYPPTTFRRADTVPFEELKLYARIDGKECTSVVSLSTGS